MFFKLFSIGSEGKLSRVLKKIKIDITDHDTCQTKLRVATRPNNNKPVLGQQFTLHSSFLCAGGDVDEDTCTGDGGSPLICPEKEGRQQDKRYFQVCINTLKSFLFK